MANVMSYWSLDSISLLRTANRQDALVVGRITGTQNEVTHEEPIIAAALTAHSGSNRAITFQIGGFGAAFHEVDTVVQHNLLHAEEIAIPLTLLLLFFVFGSLVSAAMPADHRRRGGDRHASRAPAPQRRHPRLHLRGEPGHGVWASVWPSTTASSSSAGSGRS